MKKLVDGTKNMFLDISAMGKGLVYGFVMVALLILVAGVLLYGILYLRNLIF
ncbi:hypothetical protein HF078_15885 [Bacillus sp. RO2]|uniref:hypothetical protein n=1 Tax=Bacillus sp. RO2 TaxID=2723913 RepID=UPI00145F4E6A|nr:hypothetical protein [Bacillus sp. RO2]NMH74567.1 hypothetical protein [Bacillus sp. RO2]